MIPVRIDPFATSPAPAWRFLHALNPLSKIGAVLPAMVALVFVRDVVTPLVFLALAAATLLVGARMTRALAVVLFLGLPLGVLVLGIGFALWADPSQVSDSPIVWQLGGWQLHSAALTAGLATALRLAAILALTLLSGLTTTGPELVRSGVQHLRIPYRIGYTALAAYRFVPRFGHELAIIRAAHRVRGHHGGSGPFARIARAWGYAIPLLASGIRHAERVALAMDARAFGAYSTRTERHLIPWRARDVAFLLGFPAFSAVILIALFPWQPA